ncbi:hypothetical protein RF55_2394 [Lasius niger]|uniref:Uncharacterized protein n=2 Tax=Lasius TaxID=488720 RepID=A0A0J7L3Y1_LASNI|nr:hypothetical protein RF55_2394 [Lasius niger]
MSCFRRDLAVTEAPRTSVDEIRTSPRRGVYLMLCTESKCFRKLASILDLYGQYWQEKCVSKVTMPQPIFRCFRRFDAHEYI